jgi:hypothetical protein
MHRRAVPFSPYALMQCLFLARHTPDKNLFRAIAGKFNNVSAPDALIVNRFSAHTPTFSRATVI